MIKEMLKTAGVDNMDDFYKLHPTEEHFFKTYPHMKEKVKKAKKLRKPSAKKFASGGENPVAPGKYRLFDLPGGFHYDIDADYAKYLAGSLFDTGHETTPKVYQALAAKKEAAAKAMPIQKAAVQQAAATIAARKPMYSPQVLAKIKAESRKIAEQEEADYWKTIKSDSKQPYDHKAEMHRLNEEDEANYWKNKNSTSSSSEYRLAKGGTEQVAQFQEFLNKQLGTNLVPDGAWGPKTQAAYEKYKAIKETKMPSKESVRFNARNYMDIPSEEGQYEIAAGREESYPVKSYGGYYQNGGGTDSEMQQLMQAIAQAFQQGASPEQILSSLVKRGIPQETAIQMLKAVVDQTEQGGADEQSQPLPQEEQYRDGGRLPREILRSRLESHMSPSEAQEYLDEYAKGGIHISPSKRGTFTAQATRMGMGVQEAARHILANKGKYSSKMVKKANFARNAAKWKHQEGGETMPQEQMEAPQQQMQEQAMGQEQQQGGQDQMMQQLMQMVAQALQQGVPPEQIVQMLVQQGVPQEIAVQAVQMVMQQMQGGAPQGGPGQQYQPQGGQYQGPQSMQGQPQAAYGGYYADGGFFNDSYMPFDY